MHEMFWIGMLCYMIGFATVNCKRDWWRFFMFLGASFHLLVLAAALA